MRTTARLLSLALLPALLALPTPARANAAPEGMDLPTDQFPNWGALNAPLESFVNQVLSDAGLDDAVTLAKVSVEQLANGKVPVLGSLEDPFKGDVKASIEAALLQSQIATRLVGAVAPALAKTAFENLLASPLVVDGEIAFSSPLGRIRLTRDGDELSLCMTVVGPAGSRITTGITNGEYLCGVVAPRMANVGRSTVLFADLAVGYTHIQTRLPIFPDPANPLLAPAPRMQGETYVKIHDHWLQVRLAAADPATARVDVSVSIGASAGVNFKLNAQVTGEVAVSVSVAPTVAAEIMGNFAGRVSEELRARLLTMGSTVNANDLGQVLVGGLATLREDAANPDYADSLGDVSLAVMVAGQLGVGIWDTSLAGGNVAGTITTTIPIASTVNLGATALSQLITTGLGLAETMEEVTTAMHEGTFSGETKANIEAELLAGADSLVQDALASFFTFVADVEVEFGFSVGVLGEAKVAADSTETAPTEITLFEGSLTVPVGQMVASLASPHLVADEIKRGVEAASKIALYTVGQAAAAGSILTDGITLVHPVGGTDGPLPPMPTAADFNALISPHLDDVTFSLLFMGIPLTQTGVADVSIGGLLRLLANNLALMTEVMTGMVKAARSGDFNQLRGAVVRAIEAATTSTLDAVLYVLGSLVIPFNVGIGANVDLGAEAVVELGAGLQLDGEFKTSMLLLLLNHPRYDEDHGTDLARISMPVSLSLSAGASLGEAVEVVADATGTFSASLFDFTIKHWEDDLPPPAGMTVAGFEVFDFRGTVREDESFEGVGYLMLPMGGIARADFAIDADGNFDCASVERTTCGTWTGGFELGPLGELTLASGTLDDDGMHGTILIEVLESEFLAHFTLQSTGRLYGWYSGEIEIGNHRLANVTLDLKRDGSFSGTARTDLFGNTVDLAISIGADGTFAGSFRGVLVLAGQTLSDVSLAFDGRTFTGSGSTNILGNSAVFGLTIGANTFAANYTQGAGETFGIGTFGLTGVELQIAQAGFVGSGTLTLPGLPSLELTDITIAANGAVSGRYVGRLSLFGFDSNVDLRLADNVLTGSGSLDILGSTFTATNLVIGQNGQVGGTFNGTLAVAGHTLANTSLSFDGSSLRGSGTTNLLGNTASFSLTIGSNGSIAGTYTQGAGETFGLGSLGLTGVVLNLDNAGIRGSGQLNLPGVGSYRVADLGFGATGVSGTVRGSTSLFGFDTSIDLALSNAGVSGDATLTAIGSTLEATNFRIDPAGRLTGTFSGELVAAGQTLSVSTLTIGDGELTGYTNMDIPGVLGADVILTLRDGLVTAKYESVWRLFGVANARAEFTLTADRIIVRAEMETDFLTFFSNLILGNIQAGVAQAQSGLTQAIANVDAEQAKVDSLNVQIANTLAQIEREKAWARQAVVDAEGALNWALGQLLGVLDQIASVNRQFADAIARAETDVRNAQYNLNNAYAAVNGLNYEISKLDNWYWGQNDWDRFWSWGYYQTARAALVISRDIANLALDFASWFLGEVANGLAGLRWQLNNTLAPILEDKRSREATYNFFSGELAKARQFLNSIDISPELDPRIIGLRFAHGVATAGLNFAKGILHGSQLFMGGLGTIADFLQNVGSDFLINIRAARFEADLGVLVHGRVLMEADIRFMGRDSTISFPFDFYNPVAAAANVTKSIAPEVEPPAAQGDYAEVATNTDVEPPTTTASYAAGWQPGDVTVALSALDAVSGVTSITYAATGAQAISQTTVAGSSTNVVITAQGQTTLSFYARDVAGNLEGVKNVIVKVDRTGAQATATAPTGWQRDRAEIALSASDAHSGVRSINYAAAGAFTTEEITFAGTSTVLPIGEEGITRVTYFATDNVGNRGAVNEVTVKVDRTAPASTVDAPGRWLNAGATVTVTSTDAHSGVAGIVWSASGAQNVPETTVAGSTATLSLTAPGVTTVSFHAYDHAGNVEATQTVSVQIDLTAPEAQANAPSGWQNGTVQVELSGTDEEGGSGIDSVTASATGAQVIESATFPVPPSMLIAIDGEGTTTVTYSAKDKAGNTSAPATIDVLIDLTKPVTVASAPAAWQMGPVTVGLSASDNLSGVKSITYSATGAQTIGATTVPGGDTSLVIGAEGVTTVSYFATDIAGNVEETGSIVVRVDLTKPVAVATAPSAWMNTPVTVGLAATDNLSGVATVTYAATGSQPIATTTVAGNSTSFVIEAEGITAVQYFATDVAGNVQDTGTIIVRVDYTPSVTVATAPLAWMNAPVTVDLAATDNLSGVASITYAATGANPIETTTAAGGNTSFVVEGEGVTEITYFATDVAGNVEAARTITVRTDYTVPETTVTALTTWENTPVTVELDATDNLSGVAYITYSATGAQPIDSTDVCANDTSFVISAEGVTVVTFFSTDVAGNVEPAGSVTIRVDYTVPDITFHGDRAYTIDEQVLVTCTVTDNLSGVASDDCGTPKADAPAWSIAYESGLGTHGVDATATDVAGNTAYETSSYSLAVTHGSLIALTRFFVTHDGTETALVATLTAAESSRNRGNRTAERGQLGAYLNQVSAQAGKRLTAHQANVLTFLATALRDQ